MYNLLLNFDEDGIYDCYVFDSTTYQLKDKFLKKTHLRYIKSKGYLPNQIDFTLVIIADSFAEEYIGKRSLWYRRIQNLVNEAGYNKWKSIRYLPAAYFYATQGLLCVQKNEKNNGIDKCSVGDAYPFFIENRISEHGKIEKAKFGWKIETQLVKPDCSNLNESIVNSSNIKCHVSVHLIGHKRICFMLMNHGISFKNYKLLDIEAAEYLMKIYKNESEDYSCYIPLRNYLDINLEIDGKIILSRKSENEILPVIISTDFKTPMRKPFKCEVTLSSSTVLQIPTVTGLHVPHKYCGPCEEMRCAFKIDENGLLEFHLYGKIYQNNLNVLTDFPPIIKMGKDTVGIEYYENGILKKLKDSNGLSQIPAKISFGQYPPLIGSAALDDSDVLPFSIFELFNYVADENLLSDNRMIQLNENDTWNVVVKTNDGYKRIPANKVVIIFFVSIFKLLKKCSKDKNFNEDFINIKADTEIDDKIFEALFHIVMNNVTLAMNKGIKVCSGITLDYNLVSNHLKSTPLFYC